jgi:hypothetical protein
MPMALGHELRPLPAVRRRAAGLVAEIILTMVFLFIIMGSTHGKAPVGLFATEEWSRVVASQLSRAQLSLLPSRAAYGVCCRKAWRAGGLYGR